MVKHHLLQQASQHATYSVVKCCPAWGFLVGVRAKHGWWDVFSRWLAARASTQFADSRKNSGESAGFVDVLLLKVWCVAWQIHSFVGGGKYGSSQKERVFAKQKPLILSPRQENGGTVLPQILVFV